MVRDADGIAVRGPPRTFSIRSIAGDKDAIRGHWATQDISTADPLLTFPPAFVQDMGGGIHAVAQPRRGRPVGEHVTKMRAANGTEGLDAAHPERAILFLRDVAPVDRRVEDRPTAVPESNFVAESDSGVAQQRHRYVPSRLQSWYSPLKARSVPLRRVTWYCSGVSIARHSSSRFTILFMSVSSIHIFGKVERWGDSANPEHFSATTATRRPDRGNLREIAMRGRGAVPMVPTRGKHPSG